MKVFLWLSTSALAVVCLACWVGAHLVVQSWSWNPKMRDGVLPDFTVFVLQGRSLLLFCPVASIVYAAWLSTRKELTSPQVFVLLGTLVLGIATIVSSIVIALLLPYMQLVDF